MLDAIPNECKIISCAHSVSNIVDVEEARHVVRSTVRKDLANFLANKRIEERHYDWSTEYRLTLYVFSPDEFWGIVQREAMNLMHRMPPPALKAPIDDALAKKE